MERQPIEVWDTLVHTDLYPANLTQTLLDKGAADALVKQFQDASERTRLFLMRESVSRKTFEEVRLLVERHQVYFVSQLSTVCEFLASKETNKTHLVLYELAASNLATIIQFLSTSFAAYFDYNKEVPKFILSRFDKSIRPVVSRVKKRLSETALIKDQFNAVFEIIENTMVTADNESISFHTVKYYKHLIDELVRWEPGASNMSWFDPLIEKLISLGFNDTAFLYYVLVDMKSRINEKDLEDQLLFCKASFKLVAQILESGNGRLIADKPSAKEVILDFLSQESEYLSITVPRKEGATAVPSDKIQTSLSVAVLALYIRLFKEAGIFTNPNHAQLFRAVATAFTTSRNGPVEKGHVHSKFYAIEESAKRKVYDQLMDMAKLCKKIG